MSAKKLTKKDIEEIRKLASKLPQVITVTVSFAEEGGFCAEIKSLENISTEGETFPELIEMINDAALTYFEVPRKFLPYMPAYLPSIALAKKIGLISTTSRALSDRGRFSLAYA